MTNCQRIGGKQLKQMGRGGPMRSRFTQQPSAEEAAKLFLIKKIRALHKYFETSPFVESSEVRALLLDQLETVTKRWEGSALSEILAYYDMTIADSLTPKIVIDKRKNHDSQQRAHSAP